MHKSGYFWIAIFRDGGEMQMGTPPSDSTERVKEVVAAGRPLAMLHLVPLVPGYPYIILEVGDDEDFDRVFTTSDVSGVSAEGEPIAYSYVTNRLGVHSYDSAHVYVLPDGAIRITTAYECEGYYGEGSHHGHIVDRRYSVEQQ